MNQNYLHQNLKESFLHCKEIYKKEPISGTDVIKTAPRQTFTRSLKKYI